MVATAWARLVACTSPPSRDAAALRHLAPGVLAMIMTVEVALAIVWSAVFLGERITVMEGIGATVVIAGVVLAQRTDPVGEDRVAAGV